MDNLKESLACGLRLTLFITIPAMAGLLACSTPIFSLLLMGGNFDFTKAEKSAEALFYYSLGLVFAAFAAACKDALFIFPFPTPAITMPLAPFAAAHSIKSGDMSNVAKIMSTRGICVTLVMSNSDCVVCFHSGFEKKSFLP